MSKLRLAFFSPLNPMKTGISDYSEELLPSLGDLADITLVTGPYEPSNPVIRERFPVIQAEEFLHRSGEFDCVIYQIGNDLRFHEYMVFCMARVPGLIVLHDYSLSYLVLGLTLLRGEYGTLRRLLERQFGANSGRLARRLLLSLDDPYRLSLAEPIVRMSRAIIVHSEFALDWLRREFPFKKSYLVPHGIIVQELEPPDPAVRVRYGLKPDDLVLASVSTLAYNKRLTTVLDSLPALRQRFPSLKLLLVSGGRMGSDVRGRIASLGLSGMVIQTGWVPWEEYRRLIRASNIVVNLRYPTAGETSGSALRSMEAGRPLIVSDHGSFQELPDNCCIKIPVDEVHGGEPERDCFERAAADLLGDPERRLAMGAAGRRFVCENLRMEDVAARYLSVVRETLDLPFQASADAFPPLGTSAIERSFYSTLYKAFRLRYIYRHYGLADIWNRLSPGTRRRTRPGATNAHRH